MGEKVIDSRLSLMQVPMGIDDDLNPGRAAAR